MSDASTNPIRVLIVDDETAARRRLRQLLGAEPDISVIGESADGRSACADILRLTPDLVFLDVEMPELSGIEVVEHIGAESMPATIFATAYDHYALAAFDANAVDYLLKPFDGERLAKSLAKVRSRMHGGHSADYRAQLAALVEEAAGARKYPDRLLVKINESQQLIKTTDIVYISAERNYIRLHTTAGEYPMRERMIGIQERLDPTVFRRIHRSHIVNLNHIKKLLTWFGGDSLVMMDNGSRLTLSRNYRDALTQLL